MSDNKNEVSINKTVGINKELSFLYVKCKKIKPSVITEMALVPEFMQVIKEYEGTITDEVVYALLREKSKEMYARGKGGLYRTARDVMKKVSRDVKGDTLIWEKDCEESEVDITEEALPYNSETNFLYKTCKKIKPSVISRIALVPEFVEAIKQYDGYADDEAVYEILCKKSQELYSRGKGGLYPVARDVMKKVSRDVKGDNFAWKRHNEE